MYYFLLETEKIDERLLPMDTITIRVEYSNDSRQTLLFDEAIEGRLKFLLVSTQKQLTKKQMAELNEIFECNISLTEISPSTISFQLLKKIHTAKFLMSTSNGYRGDKRDIWVTDTPEQVMSKIKSLVGLSNFKKICEELSQYIDLIAGTGKKGLFNVALVNETGIDIEHIVHLLYELFASKKILTENIMITGDAHDAEHTEKRSRFFYFIDEGWSFETSGNILAASSHVKLFKSIAKRDSIYVTSMSRAEYEKAVMFDSFRLCFPHVAILNELTNEEKLEQMQRFTGEFGFALHLPDFAENDVLELPIETLEVKIQEAIKKKLLSRGTKDFIIKPADLQISKKPKRKQSALDELESLIGLENVKKCIKEIVTLLQKRGAKSLPCLHMAFLGNPGTGKTTVARIIARIFAEIGVIKNEKLIETDRQGLVGMYVGHTAEKTATVIERAKGGVLFIDEAYSLFCDDSIDYGNEAVATLVKRMEDCRHEFVCILAGYTKEMNDMLDMNPGLRDRIQFYIQFEDYNSEQLLEIFKMFCEKNKYRISHAAKGSLDIYFKKILKTKGDNFSNGRLARKIFERVRLKQAGRTNTNTISQKDIDAVFAEAEMRELISPSTKSKIGFDGFCRNK